MLWAWTMIEWKKEAKMRWNHTYTLFAPACAFTRTWHMVKHARGMAALMYDVPWRLQTCRSCIGQARISFRTAHPEQKAATLMCRVVLTVVLWYDPNTSLMENFLGSNELNTFARHAKCSLPCNIRSSNTFRTSDYYTVAHVISSVTLDQEASKLLWQCELESQGNGHQLASGMDFWRNRGADWMR